jgi:Protein of unknown function (DUF1460)
MSTLSRRDLLKQAAAAVVALGAPAPLVACGRKDPEGERRLRAWTRTLRADGLSRPEIPLGRPAVRVGELAAGTPYQPSTLEAYLHAGGSPFAEPLTVSLTRFDCVTLVESCLAVSRIAGRDAAPNWEEFGREIERMRYRGGQRKGYTSRLHYFSEWIADGERRGLVRDLGGKLGGVEDVRPLRFMTEHRGSYPALSDEGVFREIAAIEKRLDQHPRRLILTERIPELEDLIQTGDVLGFGTAIPGLDVTHAAFAYRDSKNLLRVLHAPLSGGVVEVTRTTLPQYVAAIRRSTGILLARPLRA